MTTTEFIKINKTGRKPAFKELIGLKESGKTSTLLAFCTLKHKNASKIGQDSKVEVYARDKTYLYKIYEGYILSTDIQTKERKLYRL